MQENLLQDLEIIIQELKSRKDKQLLKKFYEKLKKYLEMNNNE